MRIKWPPYIKQSDANKKLDLWYQWYYTNYKQYYVKIMKHIIKK